MCAIGSKSFKALAIASLFFTSGLATAGVFLLEVPGSADAGEKVLHPSGYSGAGGDIQTSVCISPTSPDANKMELSVKQAIATWNGMTPVVGNLQQGSGSGIPSGKVDMESLMLHELGHCIGLGHPNMGGSGSTSEATVGGRGADGVFNLLGGLDNLIGSQDDNRGDDINYHRFAPGVNDPFRSVGSVVDRSTYTRELSELPSGHSFARNGGRAVASRMGLAPTEVVMQQGVKSQEMQRKLVADDVDTLRYARSGLDGIQGTSDDYDVTLVYGGIRTGCDIQVTQESLSPGALGFCTRSGSKSIRTGHYKFSNASTVRVNSNVNWYYTGEASAGASSLAPVSCSSTPASSCDYFAAAKLRTKPGKLKLKAKGAFIGRFQIPDEGANFAGCMYSGNQLVGQWEMPAEPGLKLSSQMMKYKSGATRFKGGKGKMIFKTSGGVPAVNPNQPVSVQVVTGTGKCWGAYFSADSITPHRKKVGVIKARY